MAKIATFYDHMKDIAAQEGISREEAMDRTRKLGVQLLEISESNILGREREVEKELRDSGLGISAIPAYFDFGRDTDVEKQGRPVLEAAKYLGADKILVIPGFFREGDTAEEKERQTVNMENCINILAEKAEKYGISLVMEDYDNVTAPFCSMRGLRRFFDRCPGLTCAFDTGNFRYAGEDVLEAYDLLRDRIGHVHLKDRSYTGKNGENPKTALDGKEIYPCPVGGGDLPLAQAVELIRRDGYDGVYTLEHYDSNACWDYLRRSVEWVKGQIF